MEKNNKYIKRGLVFAGAAMGAFALTSCTNYSGEGNEFELDGQVIEASQQSLKIEVTDIDFANGDADGWFEVGNDHRLHDNCDCKGFWRGRHTYGTVYDINGTAIEPNDVPEDACVHFAGKIRDDNDGKFHHTRPVFDIAQIVPCVS